MLVAYWETSVKRASNIVPASPPTIASRPTPSGRRAATIAAKMRMSIRNVTGRATYSARTRSESRVELKARLSGTCPVATTVSGPGWTAAITSLMYLSDVRAWSLNCTMTSALCPSRDMKVACSLAGTLYGVVRPEIRASPRSGAIALSMAAWNSASVTLRVALLKISVMPEVTTTGWSRWMSRVTRLAVRPASRLAPKPSFPTTCPPVRTPITEAPRSTADTTRVAQRKR